jgi:hypothetical protein
MDMNERVAARRAELERKQKDEAAAADEQKQAAHEVDMSDIFEGLFGKATADGAKIRRDGDKIVLDEPPVAPPTTDNAGMSQTKVKAMLYDAARKRWTPEENLVGIGLFAAAVPTLVLAPIVAAIMAAIGYWRSTVANQKYRSQLRNEYPNLFAEVPK